MNVTKNISLYVSSIGINLAELVRKSGVEYSAIYICSVLKINPMDFANLVTK